MTQIPKAVSTPAPLPAIDYAFLEETLLQLLAIPSPVGLTDGVVRYTPFPEAQIDEVLDQHRDLLVVAPSMQIAPHTVLQILLLQLLTAGCPTAEHQQGSE